MTKSKLALFLLAASLILNLYLWQSSSSKKSSEPKENSSVPFEMDQKTFYKNWLIWHPQKIDWSGYLLFGIGKQVVLLNENGKLVHSWNTGQYVSRVKLIENGNLIVSSRDLPTQLQMLNKEGEVLWTFPHHKNIPVDRVFDSRSGGTVYVIDIGDNQKKCNEILEVEPVSEKILWKFADAKKIFGPTDCQIYHLEYLEATSVHNRPSLLLASFKKVVLIDLETGKVVWQSSVDGGILFAVANQARDGVLILTRKGLLSEMTLSQIKFANSKSEVLIENLGAQTRGAEIQDLGEGRYFFSDANLRISEVKDNDTLTGDSPWSFTLYPPSHIFRLHTFLYLKDVPEALKK